MPILTKRPTPRSLGKRNFCAPSEKNTAPTIRRISTTDAGAFVLTIFCSNLIVQTSHLWRGLRRELCQVGETQARLDRANLFHRIFESIRAELFMLNVLEFVANLIKLILCHRFLPSGKHYCVFSGGMVAIHQHKRLQSLCQWLGVTCS